MSSFWDSIGGKAQDGSLTFEELQDLITFLKGFDAVNQNMTTEYLKKKYCGGYSFRGYDTFIQDIQNKGMTRYHLMDVLQNLHSFDHTVDKVLMYTYSISKNYWEHHKQYRNANGLMKNGIYTKSKLSTGFRR